MMKLTIRRIVLALLICVSLCYPYNSSRADNTFDISMYSDHKNVFDVDINTESGVAFIETKLNVSDLAFTHKYESQYTYSFMRNDILVLDYFSSDRFPVVRTWIYYSADTPQYFHSVSFELDGTTYTFTDVGDKERVKKSDNGYTESLLIRYGKNNGDFFATVGLKALEFGTNKYSDDGNKDVAVPQMKMTLHGLEDVTVDVPESFWLDFSVLLVPLTSSDNLGYIAQNEGTPCKINQ